jgi:DNA adenine methylase
MNYSPLRYPGGKGKLVPLIKLMIEKTELVNSTYIEPFAGGAGAALSLLFSDTVDHIVINDYDKSIYSFWRAIIEDTERLLELIQNTEVSIQEWYRQKNIYLNNSDRYSIELAFATFFLNRTNRSGILNAGPIGGYNQTGNYLIDARYNRENLTQRILNIANRKKQITVYNKDVRSFIRTYLPKYNNAFIYLDPPYYNKGQALYKNYFNNADHTQIAKTVANLDNYWIVTYDDTPTILNLYQNHAHRLFDLSYSLAEKKKASEVMFICDNLLFPTVDELHNHNIKINLREE